MKQLILVIIGEIKEERTKKILSEIINKDLNIIFMELIDSKEIHVTVTL